jgi:hypothetical protein
MAALSLVLPVRGSAQPTTKDLMRVLDARIQRSKPADMFKRTVLFREVRAGEPADRAYPFVVSLTIHDYSPGWGVNKYFGKTCLTKIDRVTYTMALDRLREWAVAGPTTFSDINCADNPRPRVSAFPLDSLKGTRVGKSADTPEVLTKDLRTFVLKMGEYACVLPGGRLASNRGFRLKADKSYTDATGARGGTYHFEPFSTTIKFRGGFLDGQGGKFVEDTGLVLSPTLTCSPWQ